MARIDTYTAQQGLNPGSTPVVQLNNPVADEMVNIGKQVTAVANAFAQRNEQKENFKVENDYRKMQLDLTAEMQAKAAEMQPDGTGFHDEFISNTFKPRRDQFLASVPDRLKPKFETLLADDGGADATEWSIKAATTERDQNYVFQRDEIKLAADQTAVAISMQPEAYDDLLGQGLTLIDASSLPTPEKDKLRRDWENTAQVAMLNQLLETDPQGVFRELGYDPRQLSPTTQFELVSRAVQWQESADNPNAVSGKGAVGLMQVMPGTAAEIASKIGDTNFPAGGTRDQVTQYLTNPAINKQYGEFYLREQLRAFANTRDPLEAALVAYNAGPEKAKAWVESGYDDKLLPKETRDYKSEIMASIKSSPVKGDPSSVKFVGLGEGVSSDLQGRVADAFATVGQTKVKVNSGVRSAQHNAKVGGAKGSQHLGGNAMDIDASGMKITDRIELIKALSNSGITGIGVYGNSIHADLGGRRAWGPSYGAESLPAWAKPVIGQHLNGTTPPPRAVNQRYASLPYDNRQSFVAKADQLITAQAAQTARSTAAEKWTLRQGMERELAVVAATGQGTGFDDTNVSTILGEDDGMKFARDFDVAQRTFTAKTGMGALDPDALAQRVADYVPDETSPDFVDQQKIAAAVQKESDRIVKLRANRPDAAAAEFPEVVGAYEAALEQTPSGGWEMRDPAKVQNFVRAMLTAQASFGVPEAARAPISREMALDIATKYLVRPGPNANMTPEERAKALKPETRTDALLRLSSLYEDMEQLYGEFTDEVLVYAVAEYKGLDKVLATRVTQAMGDVVKGKDPFADAKRLAATVNTVNDIAQSEAAARPDIGFGGSLFGDLFGWGGKPAADAPAGEPSGLEGDIDGDGVLSPEERIRLTENQ